MPRDPVTPGDAQRLAGMRSMISRAPDDGLLEGRAEWAAAPIATELRAAILRIADDEIARRRLLSSGAAG
jgi:hypothetical protein